METFKYTIIKNTEQYDKYCDTLDNLIFPDDKKVQDDIELITLLIGKWDNKHNTLVDSDLIELLKSLGKQG